MTKEEKRLIFSQLVKYASIIGFLVVLNSIFLYKKGINVYFHTEQDLIYNLKIIIIGLGIFYGMNHLSFRILKTKLNFWKYLLYGSLIGVFYSILAAVFFVIYVMKLAPETTDIMVNTLNEIQLPAYYPKDQVIEMAKIMYRSPVFLFFSGFFMEFINAFFNTLLFGIFYVIFPKPKNLK